MPDDLDVTQRELLAKLRKALSNEAVKPLECGEPIPRDPAGMALPFYISPVRPRPGVPPPLVPDIFGDSYVEMEPFRELVEEVRKFAPELGLHPSSFRQANDAVGDAGSDGGPGKEAASV